MDLMIWLLAGLTGYLVGSFSGARAVIRIFAPGTEIEGIKLELPGTRTSFESDVISATTVRHHLGSKYGCLTSILDILKAAIPAFLFRLWQPGESYYLAAAGMVAVGHIWPLYHQFKGGRGMSPILGGMLVVDWLGVLITQLVGGITGLVTKKLAVIVGSGFALMIPWTWFRTQSWPEVVYLSAMNVLFWIALLPEAKEIKKIQQNGGLDGLFQAEHNRIFSQGEGEEAPIPPLTDLKAWIQRLKERS